MDISKIGRYSCVIGVLIMSFGTPSYGINLIKAGSNNALIGNNSYKYMNKNSITDRIGGFLDSLNKKSKSPESNNNKKNDNNKSNKNNQKKSVANKQNSKKTVNSVATAADSKQNVKLDEKLNAISYSEIEIKQLLQKYFEGLNVACNEYKIEPVVEYIDGNAIEDTKQFVEQHHGANYKMALMPLEILAMKYDRLTNRVEAIVWCKVMSQDRDQNNGRTSLNDLVKKYYITVSKPYRITGITFDASTNDSEMPRSFNKYAKGTYYKISNNTPVYTSCNETAKLLEVSPNTRFKGLSQLESDGKIWVWGQIESFNSGERICGSCWGWIPINCLEKQGL